MRIGVGLSIGIICRPRIACGTALIATIAPIGMRSTRPSIGAIVEISATTTGSAPLARKHSSSSVRVAKYAGSSTSRCWCSSTMRMRLRPASGCVSATTSTISSL